MVVAANNVPSILLARVPTQTPAPVDMAVVLAPERDECTDERHFADVRSDAAPKLVAPAGQDVHEVGVEPAWHRDQQPNAARTRATMVAESRGQGTR